MIRRTVCFFIISMNLVFLSKAQDKTNDRMHWKIAAELPAPNGRFGAAGVAGPVAGVCDHLFIVAGGANFPDSMPWLGGGKNIMTMFMCLPGWERGLSCAAKRISFHLPLLIAQIAPRRWVLYTRAAKMKTV